MAIYGSPLDRTPVGDGPLRSKVSPKMPMSPMHPKNSLHKMSKGIGMNTPDRDEYRRPKGGKRNSHGIGY